MRGQRERGGRGRGREAAGVARVDQEAMAAIDADRVVVHAHGRGNSAAIAGRHVVDRRLVVVHVHTHADLRARAQQNVTLHMHVRICV